MSVKQTRAERRARVEQILLADHAQSNRAVARATGVSHVTVASVRAELVLAGKIAARTDRADVDKQGESGQLANLVRQPAGEPGPATKHGRHSAALRRSVEDGHRERLAREFPKAIGRPGGQDLLNAAARRAGLVEMLGDWTIESGAIRVKGGLDDVSPATRELRTHLDGYERCIARLNLWESGETGDDPYRAYRELVTTKRKDTP
jgi:hypothetical protein